jgi:hypothetical protein
VADDRPPAQQPGDSDADSQTSQRDWRGEPETERSDRNLAELQRDLYVATLMLAAIATALLVSPRPPRPCWR